MKSRRICYVFPSACAFQNWNEQRDLNKTGYWSETMRTITEDSIYTEYRSVVWIIIFNFPHHLTVWQSPVGQGLLIIDASRSHSDTSHSVGLLWKSDQPDTENPTCQHITHTKDGHPWCNRFRTRNPRKQAAADPRFRPRGHWDRRLLFSVRCKFKRGISVMILCSSKHVDDDDDDVNTWKMVKKIWR